MNYLKSSLANDLKEAACKLFLTTLDKIDGAKDLVLSQSILVQLDSICGMQKLRQNAVDKVFKLERGSSMNSETKNRVYVIRPAIEDLRTVAQQIRAYVDQDEDKRDPKGLKHWIIFVPRFVHYCDIALEEEGIYEHVSVLECRLGLLPLEYDVYSLEDDTLFKSLYLNRDITPLSVVINSILQLQWLCGNIFQIYGQGNMAKIVADKLNEFNVYNNVKAEGMFCNSRNHVEDFENLRFADSSPTNDEKHLSSFTDLFIVDRDTDFVSLLLAQANYEGWVDESFGICCNKIEFTSNKPGDAEKTIVKHSFDSDPIYRDIRDIHFSIVFSLLKTKNSNMKEKYKRSHGSLSTLKNFVANELKSIQAELRCLALHIGACEEILRQRSKYDFSEQLKIEQNIVYGIEINSCLNYISELISNQLNSYVPLRMLALLSLFQGGLSSRDYRRFYSLYCEKYGLSHNKTFENLKQIGLITEMDLSINSLTGGRLNFGVSLIERASSVLPRRGNFAQISKKLQLVPEVTDDAYNNRTPKDSAFVFNGSYIPLVCQLVETYVLGTAQNKKTVQPATLLLGPNFERKQVFLGGLPSSLQDNRRGQERSILVFFIGGVTFAEITALRFVSKKRNIKIAVATTSVINGNKLIDCLTV